MAEVQMEAKPKAKTLTKLGALVLAFATETGVTEHKQIAALVSKRSPETISPRRFRTWIYGEHEPPWWFFEAFTDTFGLSEEQMERLAWANTYCQKTKVV